MTLFLFTHVVVARVAVGAGVGRTLVGTMTAALDWITSTAVPALGSLLPCSAGLLLLLGDKEGGDPAAGEAVGDPVEATTLLKSSRSSSIGAAGVVIIVVDSIDCWLDEEDEEDAGCAMAGTCRTGECEGGSGSDADAVNGIAGADE